MPYILRRYYGNANLHFITFSCYRRQSCLGTAQNRDLFLKTLELVRARYAFTIFGYVVMPEHVHLLLSEPETSSLSTAIQVLKQTVSRKVHKSTGSGGQVWQRRWYDFNVFTERKRIEKLRYMHRNPVTRGLVQAPGEWAWSSFNWYLSGQPGIVKVGR